MGKKYGESAIQMFDFDSSTDPPDRQTFSRPTRPPMHSAQNAWVNSWPSIYPRSGRGSIRDPMAQSATPAPRPSQERVRASGSAAMAMTASVRPAAGIAGTSAHPASPRIHLIPPPSIGPGRLRAGSRLTKPSARV